jgi:hypothetical protein
MAEGLPKSMVSHRLLNLCSKPTLTANGIFILQPRPLQSLPRKSQLLIPPMKNSKNTLKKHISQNIKHQPGRPGLKAAKATSAKHIDGRNVDELARNFEVGGANGEVQRGELSVAGKGEAAVLSVKGCAGYVAVVGLGGFVGDEEQGAACVYYSLGGA